LTKEELNAALSLTRKIDRLQARLDDLRQTGGLKSPSSNTPVQGGTGTMGVGELVAELSQEIEELKKQREIERVVIGRYLQKLPLEDVEHKLMTLRYVDCYPFKAVGARIGYADRQMYRIHDKAKKLAVDGSS